MSRRRKTSPFEDLFDLVSLMPWWVGVLLAAGSHLLLRHWASQPLDVAAQQPGQFADAAFQALFRAFAGYGQYLVPILCVAAAAVSAWRAWERRGLVDQVARRPAADVLGEMSWREFEKLVGEGFRLEGYQVKETGGGGADGGVDLVLRKGAEKFLVQCKQWRAYKVGVDVVRELYGVMAARGAAGGFVVTSGTFTADAAEFAKGRNIVLVDGPRLHELIRTARGREARAASGETVAAGSADRMSPHASVPRRSGPESAPACPVCATPMVRRAARRGASAGREFWGCVNYPSCRGTRTID